jgi:membrane protein required for colicin V production
MKLDLLCLALMGFFGVLGLVSGAAKQLAHLGGVALGYICSRPLGQALGPFAARKLGFPTIAGIVGISVLSFFAVYTLGHVVIHVIVKRTLGEHARGAADRVGGFAIGVAKSGFIVFVIVSGMVLIEKALSNAGLKFFLDTKRSTFASLAREHNALTLFGFPGLDGLEKILKAAKNPAEAGQLMNDPAFQSLMKDPRIQQIAHDDKLNQALQNGDLTSALNSNKILDLLNDPSVFDKLQKVH